MRVVAFSIAKVRTPAINGSSYCEGRTVHKLIRSINTWFNQGYVHIDIRYLAGYDPILCENYANRQHLLKIIAETFYN